MPTDKKHKEAEEKEVTASESTKEQTEESADATAIQQEGTKAAAAAEEKVEAENGTVAESSAAVKQDTKEAQPVDAQETPALEETIDKEQEAPEAEETHAEEKADVTVSPDGQDKAEKEEKPAAKKTEEKPLKASKGTAGDKADQKEEEEFNWTLYEKNIHEYSEDERKTLEQQYASTLKFIEEHAILDGTVAEMTKKEVVVNIGYKSEGVIPLSEFRYNQDLKVGDQVEVYVDKTEDKDGQLVLSHKKARSLRAWERVNSALATEEIIQGKILCRTKGGLIVDVFGIESFLPGSQIDTKPIRDYDEFVGKTMEFKVVKINQEFRNVVVSHKALIEAELEKQKLQIMSTLEKGQVLEGMVKNITSYGVFVDLGGVDGLIHITDLSWGRVNHPEEMVDLDQKINVVILDFDDEKKRIALGLKQLSAHPWESLDENLKEGDKVKGKVVVLADYGAFVEIQSGVEGLIHVSEMSWSQHLRSAQDFFHVGDEVDAVILSLDKEARKMSLSVRQLTPDPWTDIETKYPVGSKQKGKVTNISHFGVFIELEEGIDGLIHISDLTWTKKISHPSEFAKPGEELEAVVLDIDKENRRLSLGHKQLEENPWDNYESVFAIGTVHNGTVLSIQDKGAVVEMPYGVEAFAPGKHLLKEDGSKAVVDEALDFKVIDFSREARRILVSHTNTFRDKKELDEERESKKKKAKAKSTKKAIKEVSSKLEKTTLGDLGVLTDIKTELEEEKAKGKSGKKAGKKAAASDKKQKKADEPETPDKEDEGQKE